jgi:RimJ/RimL family protein N-acetyltransferase
VDISFLTHNRYSLDDDLSILYPREDHVQALVQLSAGFAAECDWALTVPVGQLTSEEWARPQLFGPHVMVALVAEAQPGEMVGFIGITQLPHADSLSISLLVTASCRRGGLARRLVETAFSRLPAGHRVEMRVHDHNHASLIAAPRLGFQFEQAIEEDGRILHIYTRNT